LCLRGYSFAPPALRCHYPLHRVARPSYLPPLFPFPPLYARTHSFWMDCRTLPHAFTHHTPLHTVPRYAPPVQLRLVCPYIHVTVHHLVYWFHGSLHFVTYIYLRLRFPTSLKKPASHRLPFPHLLCSTSLPSPTLPLHHVQFCALVGTCTLPHTDPTTYHLDTFCYYYPFVTAYV